MPDSMNQPVRAGTCRWCGKPILKPDGMPRKITWHPECVTIYRIACFSGDQREAVFKRDKGVCARCGKDTLDGQHRKPPYDAYYFYRNMGRLWQADHIKPLIEANGDFSYYELSNLQTLCHSCHVEKGIEDNRRRKAVQSGQEALPL